MFSSTPQGLLDQVHKIGRAKLAQGDQRVGTGVNCFVEHLLRQPTQRHISLSPSCEGDRGGHGLGHSWRNHGDKTATVVLHGDALAESSMFIRKLNLNRSGRQNVGAQSLKPLLRVEYAWVVPVVVLSKSPALSMSRGGFGLLACLGGGQLPS